MLQHDYLREFGKGFVEDISLLKEWQEPENSFEPKCGTNALHVTLSIFSENWCGSV